MAEINQGGGGGKHKGGKARSKKMSTKIDFTPMVDLGFLLITFFMLTTTLSKPQTMELNMPDKDKDIIDSNKVSNLKVLTLLLSEKNRIYYYFGQAADTTQILTTNFSDKGIRKILLDRNAPQIVQIKELQKKLQAGTIKQDEYKKEENKIKGSKDAVTVIIKSDDKAKYKNLIDILDEMAICKIGKYALVDISNPELEMIKKVVVTN